MSSGQVDQRWWKHPKGQLHESVWDTVEFLRDSDATRRKRFLQSARLFANSSITSLSAGSYDKTSASADENIRVNVIRSMVDAVQAKIAKNKPRAAILTEGGDFGLAQKAKRLESFVWGLFHRTKLYDLAPVIFRDATVFGTGVAKVLSIVEGGQDEGDVGHIHVERVFPWELHVDPQEALYGSPRSLFQTKLIDRQVLKDMFPKHVGRIEDSDAGTRLGDDDYAHDTLADQIMVVEAWHLPSGKKAKDGKHCIVIEGATLFEEPWVEASFPFAMMRWSKPLMGFWGESLTQEVEGIQLEINELMVKIQQGFYHNAIPTLAYEEGSIKLETIDNDLRGRMIPYAPGTQPPTALIQGVFAPELYQHGDRLYQRAFEIAGVSQLAAQAKKPAGLDSGVALREFNDIESERFAIKGQDYETLFIDIAHLMLSEARRLHARKGRDDKPIRVEVVAENQRRRKSFLERIEWGDVQMEEDAFKMKVFPASSLPRTPAGRMALVETLFKSGIIKDSNTAMHLLDFPDVEATMSRELAALDIILDMLEEMVDHGRKQSPEPFMDLALTLKVVQQSYLRAKIDRVPEARLEMLRKFMDATQSLMEEATAKAAPAAGPAGPSSPDGGMPMPEPMPGGAPVPGGPVAVPTPEVAA